MKRLRQVVTGQQLNFDLQLFNYANVEFINASDNRLNLGINWDIHF